VNTLDESVGARLHHGNVAFVVFDRAGCGDLRRQRFPFDQRSPHAQSLLRSRVNTHAAAFFIVIGVNGDQLHIHKRRLTGFIEAPVRHHGIVPIEHAFGGGGVAELVSLRPICTAEAVAIRRVNCCKSERNSNNGSDDYFSIHG
jgi:hypothetical protein